MSSVASNYWDEVYESGKDFKSVPPPMMDKIVSSRNGASSAHLDIGCGTGLLSREMYHRGYVSVGVDMSSKAIEIAKQSTIYSDKIHYYAADFEIMDLSELVLDK